MTEWKCYWQALSDESRKKKNRTRGEILTFNIRRGAERWPPAVASYMGKPSQLSRGAECSSSPILRIDAHFVFPLISLFRETRGARNLIEPVAPLLVQPSYMLGTLLLRERNCEPSQTHHIRSEPPTTTTTQQLFWETRRS